MAPEVRERVAAIACAKASIYDSFDRTGPLWLTGLQLEEALDERLRGTDLSGLALRTRSKEAKKHVCRALGLPIPAKFRKTQPRFPCLDFDTYVQKSDNLQIWNEEVSPYRRYVLIRLDQRDVVTRVKVITGEKLAQLDTTGTLTQKLQARLIAGAETCELATCEDTSVIRGCLSETPQLQRDASPSDPPTRSSLLPIREVFRRILPIVGKSFVDRGPTQDRNRGGDVHSLVAKYLGYEAFADNGQFPDVLAQLLEIKLQTSPTIDLGLVSPDSTAPLDVPQIADRTLRHCDVRYAIFSAHTDGKSVEVTGLIMSTGEGFFSRFPQFQGNIVNRKIQIPLPAGFFDG